MGCRPSRSSLGRVADSSWEYNRKYVKDQKEKKLKSKKSGRGGRRKAPVYNDFSCTSKIYTNLNSKSSKITVRLSTDGSTLEIEQFDIDLNACADRYKQSIGLNQTTNVPAQLRSPELLQNCATTSSRFNYIIRSRSAPELACLTQETQDTKVGSVVDQRKVTGKQYSKSRSTSKPKKSKSVSEKGFVSQESDFRGKKCQHPCDQTIPGGLRGEVSANDCAIDGIGRGTNSVCNIDPCQRDSSKVLGPYRIHGCKSCSNKDDMRTRIPCNNGESIYSARSGSSHQDQNCHNNSFSQCKGVVKAYENQQIHTNTSNCDSYNVFTLTGAPNYSANGLCCCCRLGAAGKCNYANNWLTTESDYVCKCSKEAVQSETNYNQPNSRPNKLREHGIPGNEHKPIIEDVNQSNRSRDVPNLVSADENLTISQNGKIDWCNESRSLQNDNLSVGYLNSLESARIKRHVSDIDYSGRNVLLPISLTNGFKNGDECLSDVQSPIAQSIQKSNMAESSNLVSLVSRNETELEPSPGNHLVLTDDKQHNSDDNITCCKTTNLNENLVAIETPDKLAGLSEGTNCGSGLPTDFVLLMRSGRKHNVEINPELQELNLAMIDQEMEEFDAETGTSSGCYVISGEESDETSPEYEESLDESFEKRFDFSFYTYEMLKISSPKDYQAPVDESSSSEFEDEEFLDALESTYV